MEGTAASVAAQLLYLWALEAAGLLAAGGLPRGAALVLPVAACAVVEALTEQVRLSGKWSNRPEEPKTTSNLCDQGLPI